MSLRSRTGLIICLITACLFVVLYGVFSMIMLGGFASLEEPGTAGSEALRYLILALVVIAGVFGAAILLLMEKAVLSRLDRLSREIRNIGAAGDLARRITAGGKDELGSLGRTINGMLDNLEESEKAARRSFLNLATVLDATADGVVVLDLAGQVLLFNPAAERMLQRQRSQVVAQDISSLGVEALSTALRQARNAGASLLCEITAPGNRTLHASLSPVQEVGWVLVMHDITTLKELDQLRTDWVTIISHDLKSPIASIQLSARLIQESGALNELQAQGLDIIQRSSQHLRSLVVDVLDLARLEAGPALRPLAVDMKEVIAASLAEVEPLVQAKGHSLQAELSSDLPATWGDAALLKRVLVHLLKNATSYTMEGGQIMVRAYSEDDSVIIEVSDTGRGIPPELIPRIFDRFYRVPGSEKFAQGSGLGLNIVKSIVEKHGGRIWVESQPAVGSTFAFTIPLEKKG